MATLRQQLALKRSLRQVRIWAPPISIGVLAGTGAFFAIDQIAPANEQPAEPAAYVSYANCDAARAAGAAPLYRGHPGYNRRLDADHDGVACEPYPR